MMFLTRQEQACILIQSSILLFVIISTPLLRYLPPQAVVDLLVMREWLWSEARSVTFSFMHDCFSSINISAGRHQQHRQDQRREKRGSRNNEVQAERKVQHTLFTPNRKASGSFFSFVAVYSDLRHYKRNFLTCTSGKAHQQSSEVHMFCLSIFPSFSFSTAQTTLR